MLSSGIPYFQWIGVTLIGWSLMQFAEMLLWLTNPRKGCTFWNKVITMTLIPFSLFLQPLGSVWGSTFVFPWDKSSLPRKNFMVIYTLFMAAIIYREHFWIPTKYCTTVTDEGHLYWYTVKDGEKKPKDLLFYSLYYGWLVLIVLPLFMFWNKSLILPLLLMITPSIGFYYGLKSDSAGTIWCYYTSYASVIAIICLFMQQNGIYDFLAPSSFHF